MFDRSARTVLVAEDDPKLRRVVAKMLELCGYRVAAAPDGAAAVRAAAGPAPISLIVLDVMMPGMDGYQALARMRAAGLAECPVVMLTAQGTDGDVRRGYRVGVDYYLTKPFKADRLLNIVDYLIGDLPEPARLALEQHL